MAPDDLPRDADLQGGYGKHPLFVRPPADEPLGRYMTMAKFEDLVQNAELYFSRADVLLDQFEGRVPASIEEFQSEELEKSIQEDRERLEAAGAKIRWFDNSAASLKTIRQTHRESQRARTFMSCWHTSSNESPVMWERFALADGVLLATDFSRLERALPERWEYAIYAGRITYSEYDPTKFPMGNVFDPLLHKRKTFAEERELRVMFNVHGRREVPIGIRVPVDLKALVKTITLAPGSRPESFAHADEILEQAGIKGRSSRSTLE